MGRSMRYPVGSTVNGYKIAVRDKDTRVAWVHCQHPGCHQIYKVQMSNIIHAQARRFCEHHQVQERQRRKMDRLQHAELQRNIAAAAERAANQPEQAVVYGRVAPEMTPMRQMLDVVAVRTAWDRAGMQWKGHINDGRCFGWFMVDCRERTEGNAVRWRAFCAVCGTGRIMYDAQLKRRGANRCWHCMGPKVRFEKAQNAFKRAEERGLRMDEPEVLLRVAAWLADSRFDDDGCRKWTRDAAVTFDAMLRGEQSRLVGADEPAPVEVKQEEDVDWWETPVKDWPTPVLKRVSEDMRANPNAYIPRFGALWMSKLGELRSEVLKREENGDEGVEG